MREWLLNKMRRRSRRGPNDSESTGKSGQELPSGQLAPLRPTYPEPIAPQASTKPEAEVRPAAAPVISQSSELPVEMAPAEPAFTPADPASKMVVETQPDSLATPAG